jgi:N6-adenosine-specific RNA methylase IME4
MKYQIIYADPAWSYKDKACAGKRGAIHKYSLMNNEDIINLPVYNIADENCICFLWTTFPLLDIGIETIKKWGFEYKTVAFVWIKKNPKSFTNFFGMGNWTRSNAEVVLIGIKGKIKRVDASISQIVEHPILKPHSRKPAIIRDKIVQLIGDLKRVELFATENTNGWDCIGYDANGQDVRDFLDKDKGVKSVKTG